MIIVVSGTIGQSGIGGQVWATLQYLLGLRAMGHHVVYLEDCGTWNSVYDWERGEQTEDIEYPASFLRESLEPFGFGKQWIYRVGGESRGMSPGEFVELCSRADLLLMRASPIWHWRSEYDLPRRRAFIDVDPGFTQMRMLAGNQELRYGIARCSHHFTVGLNIGRPECEIPSAGFRWIATAPPVFLDEWPQAEGRPEYFTSIMRWRGFHDVQHGGVAYGQKDREFPQYLTLPSLTAQRFQLAVLGADVEQLIAAGWDVLDGKDATGTASIYREYVRGSRAEFSVPKHAYVAIRSGWFSDRSVCYLAAGRPVLVGDTGLTGIIPVGDGLCTFSNLEQARAGVEHINANYDAHRESARKLAEEQFESRKVLGALLEYAVS